MSGGGELGNNPVLTRIPPLSMQTGGFNVVFCALAVALAALSVRADSPEQVEFFEKRIRPILVERCYECHSAEAKKLKAGFRVDSREALLKGGESAKPSIVPGEPEKSQLIEAVRWSNPDLQMPPKTKLSDAQLADLEIWVKLGATYPAAAGGGAVDAVATARENWPFTPVKRPSPPVVRDPSWPKSPIDQFILSKLEENGLRPAEPADKRALIRRATYDLTGLPPTIEDVEMFVADSSPNAFEKVVDRLLASPAYGQRYARHWLDVVRYTDSFDARDNFGPKDCAEAWRYRDWVVDALNRDLPYDQFVKAQIAGDLLAERSPEPAFDPGLVVATTVYAIGNWGGGDADKEKLLTDIADDQVDLTGRAFLGMTIACARCHDHKFDPISAEDYYAMAGIFFSSHILPEVGPKTAGPDMLKIPLASKAELRSRDQAKAALAAAEKKLDAALDDAYASVAKDVITEMDQYLIAAYDQVSSRRAQSGLHAGTVQRFVSLIEASDLRLMSDLVKDIHNTPGVHAFKNAGKIDTPSATFNTTAQEQRFITIAMPPRSVAVHPSPKAGASIVFRSPVAGPVKISASVADADPNCGNGVEYKLLHRRGGVATELATGAMPNGGKAAIGATQATLTVGDLVELLILPKGDYSCDTTVVDLAISQDTPTARTWGLTQDVLGATGLANPAPDGFGNAAVWHFVDRADGGGGPAVPPDSALGRFLAAARDPAAKRDVVEQAAKAAASASSGADQKVLADLKNPRSWFWSAARADDANLPPGSVAAVKDLKSQISNLKSQIAKPIEVTQGLQEGGVPGSPHAGVHDVKLHIRGRYDRLGPIVSRRFPRVLAGDSQSTISQGSGRFELANWVASPSNPLTARVMVNRLWQWHFGEGIVRTANNFGKLGTPPTHPELLDWLADEFITRGWSIKAMHRLIMFSATYQQSTSPQTATLKADPDNLLLGRMNRRRLDAEGLRDTMLAITGEIDLAGGGRATKELNSPRRTLYLMTIRSDRSSYRMLFDAADPTAIIEKRIDSTVAPQALWLFNHPFSVDRAKKLAAEAASPRHASREIAVSWLYRRLFAREATAREIQLASAFLGNSPDEKRWTRYCHALLCSNELMYVD
jgi:hypothetical protein